MPRWQTILLWAIPVALLAIAIWMRLNDLGQPFDHDGYDEGVYWQSLRAMGAGYTLYKQIFYSQPPFFLLSTYPTFALFGSTLWSARFGIALVSLLGLPGAYVMGRALQGRIGALLAMLLLVLDPLYLSMSQKIEAEVSSAAFSLLAVGAAYLWWENPDGFYGLLWAALSGITLALGILCKLLSVTSIVPIALLLLARLWQLWRNQRRQSGIGTRGLRPILILILTGIVTSLAVLLPFLSSSSSMIRDVITFHTDARAMLINNQIHNGDVLLQFWQLNWPLIIAASFGLLAALWRRDWRVLPLLIWALATLLLLWEEVPLFYRHFVALTPTLIALAVLGLGDLSHLRKLRSKLSVSHVLSVLAIIFILIIVGTDLPQYQPYYQMAAKRGTDTYAKFQVQVANDVRNSTAPGQLVVTDGQFVVAMADRNTPPSLVDTSIVRVVSSYVTLRQLEDEASQPQVHAVLFFMARLNLPQVAAFYTWVTQHFHLKSKYGPGKELWVR